MAASFDIYQVITDQVCALLEQGVAPWKKPWSVSGVAPQNLVSHKAYRGINTFLLNASNYQSPYWLTYKQATEKGGHIRKGEHGTRVVFWKLFTKETEDEEQEEISVKTLPLLRFYTVFNVEQCEGVESPSLDIPEWPENKRIEKAEAVQLGMPNRPQVTYGGTGAFYNPLRDYVNVPEFKYFENPAEFYSALFHELGHSTSHASRLNRQVGNHTFGSHDYAQEELVAEMTSAFLCGYCGIETSTIENSAAYMQGWLKALRNDKKLVVVAAAQAQKAANYILGLHE